ncbi:MAG TPA: ATP-binding cassette domain-containing protein [Solirubrobacteraceae bacterium]|nr:ATP-binding cassette domain-containing protein [Solirubrobacteraceae bacterium]
MSFESVPALEGINLRVGAGELVAVCGEPGAGKTALVRCIAGDLPPSTGTIRIDGVALGGTLRAAERQGIAVVWQDISLCENLDVAGNLLLGQERPDHMFSVNRLYAHAREVLDRLEVPIENVMQRADTLSGGQRGLLALAMAIVRRPRVLLLDEPTAAMGILETSQLEQQLMRLRQAGVALVLATRDVGQMFRIADRVVVLRDGRIVTEIRPQDSHPDDVAALLAGGTVDGSARRQLTRLHGLADSLAVSDPSSGLALIVGALAAALNVERSAVDVIRADPHTTPVERVIVTDGRWLVPVAGSGGPGALITIRREGAEAPSRDEEDLLGLYAGYAAAAIERQDAEQARTEAAALRRSRELQRQFLSRLSHELRTPLTAIRGYASSLLAPDIVWDADSQQRFLETIAAESSRLGRLVDDLLDFSAIDSGVMRMQFDWCQLDLVIEAAIACLPDRWREAVSYSPVAHIPPIWADHDRLEQVFVNLLNNALQHNPPGTRVSIAARLSGGQLEIIVSDDGQGLPAELRESPFDSPRRHRSSTAGAGLGLSIARGIMLAHDGALELADGPRGTSFRIVLALERPEAAPEPAHPALAVTRAPRPGERATQRHPSAAPSERTVGIDA